MALVLVKALGIYLIVSGLFVLFRGKMLAFVLQDLFKHPALLWLAGLVLIIIGSMIAFTPKLPAVVSVLGWLTLAKGIIYILYPQLFYRLTRNISRARTIIWAIFYIALGIMVLIFY